MTASTAAAAAHFRTQEANSQARKNREALKREVEAMSDAMVNEKGLLNHAQAALLLDVSTRRVTELVELGKLARFDFLGRTYVSMREVKARRETDVKAGRPRRGHVERVITGVKMALKGDRGQLTQGGYTDFAAEQLAKKKAKRAK